MKTNKWIWIFAVVCLVGVFVITTKVGSKNLEITEQIPAEEVQSIEITNDSWDVEVEESFDNKIHVNIEGKQKDKKKVPVEVIHKDNSLIIQQHKQIGGPLSNFTFEKEGTITIGIPNNTVEQVAFINNAGDLNVQSLAVQKLNVENQSGYIKLYQIEVESGVFNLNQGELKVNNSSFDIIDVAAKGNDIYFNNVTSSVFHVFSKKGEVVLKEVVPKSEISVETEAGDIQIAYSSAPSSLQVAVENTEGDTSVNLGNFSATNQSSKKVNGTIGAGEYSLRVKSYSGNIDIK